MDFDRIAGTLFGLAAGDKIGGPIRMALQLSNSLLNRQAFDIEDVLAHYMHWWKTVGFDTGPVAHHVFKLIDKSIPYETATLQVHNRRNKLTAGCNPSHRAIPLAMAGFIQNNELAEIAHEEASLTHWDSLAGDVSESAIMICRLLIQGVTWDDTIRQLLSDEIIQKVIDPSYKQQLSKGGFAPDVLLSALYFVTQHATFNDALTQAIAFAGSANYCPVLVGAFAGARWGKASIPSSQLHHGQSLLPDIETTCNKFLTTWVYD